MLHWDTGSIAGNDGFFRLGVLFCITFILVTAFGVRQVAVEGMGKALMVV